MVTESHLPILQIIVPLVAAPLCVFLRQKTIVWAFALIVSWITLAIAIINLRCVLDQGVLSYALGSWVAPWGIEIRIDVVNAYILLLIAIIGAVILLYAPSSIYNEIPSDSHNLFYSAYLLCLTGLLGITATGDAFNLFVFLEISSLASYALISMGKDRCALMAAYQYLVLGTIGATFILIGIGFMYMMTGTLNMADLATQLESVKNTLTIITAFAFLSVGISLKLALFPLHMWLPNAYVYAPSVVTAFLAATATKVSIYVLLRFIFTLFGTDFSFETLRLDAIILPLALIGIFVGSIIAVFQNNIKRMLAYSSVAQIGYMILGISFVSLNGLTGGIVHLFNHALMKGALFLIMGGIAMRIGSVNLNDMRGLGKRMPVTMAGFILGGLSLIGVPLTVGFISKWYLVLAAIEKGMWLVAILILLGSLIAVIYIWRVIEVAYFQENELGEEREIKELPLTMQIAIWLLIVSTIIFWIFTPLTLGIANKAASLLLGVSL